MKFDIASKLKNCRNKELHLVMFIVACLIYGIGNFHGLLPFYTIDLIFYIQILFVVLFYRKIPNLSIMFIVFGYITLLSLLNYKYIDDVVVKTYSRFILFSIVIISLLYNYKNKPETVIKGYVFFCKIIAGIALVQFAGILINIKHLYDFSYLGIPSPRSSFGGIRVASLATEPAWMIQYLIPAIYLALGRLLFKDEFAKRFLSKRLSIFILLACVVSKSSLFLISLPAVLFFYVIRLRAIKIIQYFFIGFFLMAGVFVLSYKTSSDFKNRIDAVVALQSNLKNSDNWSVFALLSNFYVTAESVPDHYYVGSGIDTHRLSYDNYIKGIYPNKNFLMYLNKNDSGSFYLRIFSEFGLIGALLLVVLFINRYRNSTRKDYFFFYFSCLLVFGIRNGQYINLQFLLFFWGILLTPYFKVDENSLPDRHSLES